MPKKILAESRDSSRKVSFWAKREQDLRGPFCQCPAISKRELSKLVSIFLKYYLPTGYFSGKFPENREKFRKVQDGLYEIKSHQLRLLGFFNQNDFIIVLCVRKKRDDLKPKDISKALKNIDECQKEMGV